jgi:hypothetical protein
MLLKVVGTKTTSVIFMGDIWKPRTQWDSRYLWMPLEIGDGKMSLPEPREWTLDIKTGEAKLKNNFHMKKHENNSRGGAFSTFLSRAEMQTPIPLWPDGAPGALGTNANDIPTLTPYLPDATNATGAAMVICPGGGYGAPRAARGQ